MKQLNPKYSIAIVAFLCCFSTQKVKAQVNTQDSLALVDLYDSTGGFNWRNHTNWLTKAPVSSWFGVDIVNSRVNSLRLSFNKLSGQIPTSITNLTDIDRLDLSINTLSGAIPTTMNNLINLKYLDLGYNSLSGNIPFGIGGMTNAINISITGNSLSGNIPSSIGSLTNLQYLSLSGNKLSGTIPSSIGNLKKLVGLDLYYNQLTGNFPIELTTLPYLHYLQMNNNQFSDTIPASIGNLTNLSDLDLSYNKFSGNIPPTIGNLVNVVTVNLTANQFSGNIPSTIGNLGSANEIDLDGNKLTGPIPSTIGNLWDNLHRLHLSYNKLSGQIPATLDSLKGINELYINNNSLTFNGLEFAARKYSFLLYSPQETIHLNKIGNQLSVSVGGTPANNTYKWYKDGNLVATNVGDSTYTATSNGKYRVAAINSVATQLTLYSDTINITTLPVTISFFAAATNNSIIQTNWHTTTELNTTHFSIQHSTDGSSFTDIGTVKAIGSGAHGYQFTDNNPTSGINYYMLKSIDKDGSFAYSKVVSVQLTVDRLPLTVAPNPAKDKVTVKGVHIVSVQVVDNMGKVIKTQTLKDATNPSLSVNSLPVGVYHLRIQTTDGKVSGVGFVKE